MYDTGRRGRRDRTRASSSRLCVINTTAVRGVVPACRGRGLGRALLLQALAGMYQTRDGVPVIVKMTPDRLATIRRAALRAVRKFACV